MSWSDTQIIATVAANATSGSARVRQNEIWSNAVTMAQVVIEFGAPSLGLIMDALLSVIETPSAIETEYLSGSGEACPPGKDALEASSRKFTDGQIVAATFRFRGTNGRRWRVRCGLEMVGPVG